jgi:hypothetical protein
MKTITIEFNQFRDQLDRALAEAERGELILTRDGKPRIVMRPASDDRASGIPSEADNRGRPASDPHGGHYVAISLVGKTVGDARAHFEKVYKTTLGGMAFVNGKQVPEDHVLEAEQVLEFAEEPEDEEWAAEMHRSPDFWEMIRRRRGEATIPWDEVKRQLGIG